MPLFYCYGIGGQLGLVNNVWNSLCMFLCNHNRGLEGEFSGPDPERNMLKIMTVSNEGSALNSLDLLVLLHHGKTNKRKMVLVR